MLEGCAHAVPLPGRKARKAPKPKKDYVPAIGTANYAFLVTLWQVGFQCDLSHLVLSCF